MRLDSTADEKERKLQEKLRFAGEKVPSMKRRSDLNDYYGRHIYMVTMAVEGRRPLLGRLVAALAAAHNGAVTYTAAISEGEKLIARTLREQGYPLVVLLNDGFPKEGSPHERYYKPGGVYFEACCRGRLLLLEPAEQSFLDAGIRAAVEETLRRKAEARHWAYTPIPVTSQRYRFVALNEMAKRLAQGE